MSMKALAPVVLTVGIIVAVVSALADPLGAGRSPGFGGRQLLGVVAGLAGIAAGLFARRRGPSPPGPAS